MSDFHSVKEEFKELLATYDFKLPKKLWYDHLVAFSKHLEDIYYCYVIARVFKHDGSLQTDLWVGPINRPDDGLQNLSANINVKIDYTQVPEASFFANCEKKILHLIQAGTLDDLVKSAKNELAQPSNRNYRYEVYSSHLLPFFKEIVNEADHNRKILGNKKSLDPIIEKVWTQQTGDHKFSSTSLDSRAPKTR